MIVTYPDKAPCGESEVNIVTIHPYDKNNTYAECAEFEVRNLNNDLVKKLGVMYFGQNKKTVSLLTEELSELDWKVIIGKD